MALRDYITGATFNVYCLGVDVAFRHMHLHLARVYRGSGQPEQAAAEIRLAKAAQQRVLSTLRSLREYRAAGDRRTA